MTVVCHLSKKILFEFVSSLPGSSLSLPCNMVFIVAMLRDKVIDIWSSSFFVL